MSDPTISCTFSTYGLYFTAPGNGSADLCDTFGGLVKSCPDAQFFFSDTILSICFCFLNLPPAHIMPVQLLHAMDSGSQHGHSIHQWMLPINGRECLEDLRPFGLLGQRLSTGWLRRVEAFREVFTLSRSTDQCKSHASSYILVSDLMT